ncbi:MAG: UDP-N-acetylmuramate dehydrogenase [Candidatus Gracilibacteria bacterium]|jgi:UDP-N-acetylmuramate dehydrogenase|nr:UDP-N-acetylmuramate dehydrogenase [Candidatus Gracilibacteria bacterium]MDD5179237.1 UDP-N-acetylmuramate dehydrogenase [Candidatus Gracilibacteria bacterium]
MKIEKGVSLAQFTTLRVGGKADAFVRVKDCDEAQQVLRFAQKENLPVYFLGSGANILFSDVGFRGLVIKNEIFSLEFSDTRVKVGSGIPLAALVMETAQRGLAGLQNLAGVPGTFGGGIAGNANEIGEKLISATLLDSAGEIKKVKQDYFAFAYRYSNLKKTGEFLVEGELQLENSAEDLRKQVAQLAREKVLKQPYEKTAGSWFKNPEGKKAWELITQSGCSGLRSGDAQVSKQHANFFQNVGHAKARDFLELEKQVKEAVQNQFGIELEREVVVVE